MAGQPRPRAAGGLGCRRADDGVTPHDRVRAEQGQQPAAGQGGALGRVDVGQVHAVAVSVQAVDQGGESFQAGQRVDRAIAELQDHGRPDGAVVGREGLLGPVIVPKEP